MLQAVVRCDAVSIGSRLPSRPSEEYQCSSWSNPGCVVSAYHPATYAWDNATKKICYLHSDRKSNKAPIHRADWPPASVTVKSGCTLTQAEGCVYESKADLVVAQTRIGCWSSR